jgi:alpha-acetolactate decarboxylase
MRIALFCLGLTVVINAVGCQPQSNTDIGSNPDREPSTIAQAEPAEPAAPTEKSDVVSNSTEHAQHSETEDHAHGGPGMKGRGPGGMGRGPGAMGGMRGDMATLHAMFDNSDKIQRTITNLPDGAEAVTESDDDKIARLLQEHVPAMEARVTGNNPLPPMTFHPIFVELIKHSDEYTLTYEETKNGMKVKYSSNDPYVVMLVQEHAKLVSRFIKNGMEEIHKPYTLPKLEDVSKPVPETWDGIIIQFGSMHEAIGQQNHQGRVSLKSLSDRPHFFGVGALEKLGGEVTIQNGNATITRVGDKGRLEPGDVSASDIQATLLVGADVPNWTIHPVATNVAFADFDQHIAAAATKAGLNVARPIVFVIEGEFTQLKLHVIHGACPLHSRRNQIELPVERRPYEAEFEKLQGSLIGVFAQDAAGKITHPGTTIHMHLVFRDADSGHTVTGHIEQTGMLAGAVLRFPKTK